MLGKTGINYFILFYSNLEMFNGVLNGRTFSDIIRL